MASNDKGEAPSLTATERGVIAGALLLTALRLAVAPGFELFPQEAYYDLYANHLALSYFDHPPLIGWLLHGFEAAFGHRPFVLRLCAFTLTAATQLLFVQLVREAVPPERRAGAFLWLVTPAVSVVSLIASPDVPLLLFWTGTLFALWRALSGSRMAWLVAGLSAGLAFDGKYTAAYLPVGVLLLLAQRDHRHHLRSPWPWVAAALGLVMTAPVLVWNAQHGFASLRFQTVARAQASIGIQWRFPAGLLGSQLVLVGPAILLGLAWLAKRVTDTAFRSAARFWAVFSLPPLFLSFGLSLFVQVKPNWLEPFYVAGVPLVAMLWPRPQRLLLFTGLWSFAVHLGAAVELLAAPVAIQSDDTFVGWKALAAAVDRLREPGSFVFSTDGYKTSAELWFYEGQRVYSGEIVGQPGLQFEYFDNPCPPEDDALLVRSARHGAALPASVASHFDTAEPLPPIEAGPRRFLVWKLKGYRRDVKVCR